MATSRPLLIGLTVVALAAGFVWAPAAAGIGVTVGFALLASGIEGGLVLVVVGWLLGRRRRGGDRDADGVLGLGRQRIGWTLLLVATCGLVAALGADGRLTGHGWIFVPAVLPFLLITWTIPGNLRRPPASSASASGVASRRH
jgi:hypothetical protein